MCRPCGAKSLPTLSIPIPQTLALAVHQVCVQMQPEVLAKGAKVRCVGLVRRLVATAVRCGVVATVVAAAAALALLVSDSSNS